ncbi:hypothetical protein, partial [Aeromonas caviae]|uniref:hypothetical protein n=1 Tax=Aeromonas caviae TaxID=648 RepID=UPI0035A242C2
MPGRILSGNGVHRFRNHCSNSPEYAALKKFDEEYHVTSFCGAARRIDDHYVTPVIQIPNSLF